MIDYTALLYGPVYDVLGVAAVLTPAAGDPVDLTMLDKTAGVEVAAGDGVGTVMTVRPAAIVRMPELAAKGLTRQDVRRASLVMNGKTWRVENTMPKPSPAGEADGELYLILSET